MGSLLHTQAAQWNTQAINKLNTTGAIKHPCLTPALTSKGSLRSPWLTILAIAPSRKSLIIVRNLGGQPKRCRASQRRDQFTVSNAFVRSTNTMYKARFCSKHFSCSCLTTKIMSEVHRPLRKPHWLSGKMLSAKLFMRRNRTILAKTLPQWRAVRSPYHYHKLLDLRSSYKC